MKRVLVTGATGKTGSHVLRKLRAEPDKFEAIGLARSPEKSKGNVRLKQRFCYW